MPTRARSRPSKASIRRALRGRPTLMGTTDMGNSVLFPMSVVPINVGRPRSARLIEALLGRERALVGIVRQKSAELDEPTCNDHYEIVTPTRSLKVKPLGK